ncbi:hypothetical protein JCM21900_004127 [Sporobolomyces salmonicolor]
MKGNEPPSDETATADEHNTNLREQEEWTCCGDGHDKDRLEDHWSDAGADLLVYFAAVVHPKAQRNLRTKAVEATLPRRIGTPSHDSIKPPSNPDHLEHRQYDSTHTLEGQDPAEKEHYEHIMHDPHKPLDAKLNAADALEALPHCQQNVDVEGFRETD